MNAREGGKGQGRRARDAQRGRAKEKRATRAITRGSSDREAGSFSDARRGASETPVRVDDIVGRVVVPPAPRREDDPADRR